MSKKEEWESMLKYIEHLGLDFNELNKSPGGLEIVKAKADERIRNILNKLPMDIKNKISIK